MIIIASITACETKMHVDESIRASHGLEYKTSSSDSIFDDSTEYYLKERTGMLTTAEVYDSMLHFENPEVFMSFMDEFSNKSITVFESIFNNYSSFSSLYLKNEIIEEGLSSGEDLPVRIPDIYFEAVLNENQEIRIADTIFRLLSDFKSVEYYLVENGIRNNLPFKSSNGICTCDNEANCFKTVEKYRQIDLVRKYGEKFVMSTVIYSSVGFKAFLKQRRYYSGKPSDWEKIADERILSFIDHYYHIKYWKAGPGGGSASNPNYFSNKVSHDENAHTTQHTVAKYYGGVACVEEFGRTHNWNCGVSNYADAFLLTWFDLDCHNDSW